MTTDVQTLIRSLVGNLDYKLREARHNSRGMRGASLALAREFLFAATDLDPVVQCLAGVHRQSQFPPFRGVGEPLQRQPMPPGSSLLVPPQGDGRVVG